MEINGGSVIQNSVVVNGTNGGQLGEGSPLAKRSTGRRCRNEMPYSLPFPSDPQT